MYKEIIHDENLNYQEKWVMHYLIDIWPMLEDQQEVEGVIYKRLSDSFIQEMFPVSSNTLRNWLNDLVDNNYIKIWKPKNNSKGVRYYTITLQIDKPYNSGYYSTQEDGYQSGYQHRYQNRYQKLITNNKYNNYNYYNPQVETNTLSEYYPEGQLPF